MKTGLSKKPVRVHLLNKDSVLLVFESKSTVQQLFDQVCSLLTIKEGQFFGLSTLVDNEKLFMDLKQKITKYAPKDWGKEIKRRVSDVGAVSSTVLSVQFQVQFYVEHPKLISDKDSRHQYYLQMRNNVLRSRVLTQDEVLFTLASHALQADLGDHDPAQHKQYYFNTEDYFPSWFIEKWGRDYLLSHLPALHAEHRGKTTFEAQAQYIQQASKIDDVPVHYYKLYKGKRDTKAAVLLGIFHQGIRIHYGNPEKPQGPWKLEFEFMWNKVGRLFFTGKRFEIYPEDLPASRRLTYYTGSHARSKYLLHFLRDSHSLYMSLSPYAQHMCRADGRRLKRWYHESYIGGKNLDLERSVDLLKTDLNSSDNKDSIKKAKQETHKLFNSHHNSTTSHGSSHTSGIESDKQRAGEEDEDYSPTKQFVDITDDHLAGPPPKSLSVDNLRDYAPDDLNFSNLSLAAKTSAKPSRDSTLKGEDFCITAQEFKRASESGHAHTSPTRPVTAFAVANNEFAVETGKTSFVHEETKDVPHEYFTAATLEKKEVAEKKQERSNKVPGTKKKAKRRVSDRSTQTLTPQGKLEENDRRHYGQTGNTRSYFSDIHTIPRGNHGSGQTRGGLNSDVVSQMMERPARQKECAKRSQLHAGHRQDNVKQSSSVHLPANTHPHGQKKRAHSSGGKTTYGGVEMARQNASDCIPSRRTHEIINHTGHSAFVPVSKVVAHAGTSGSSQAYAAEYTDQHIRGHHRNTREKPGPHATGVFDVHENPVERRKHHHSKKSRRRSHNVESMWDKYSAYHHQSQDQADMRRMSSFEDEAYSQAISDVCNRTLTAQRRKISDSRSSQRMDSGRSSLRTTDESSCCVDVRMQDEGDCVLDVLSPHSPVRKSEASCELTRRPFIENYKEVIV